MRELQFLIPTKVALTMDEMRGEESRASFIRRALDDLLSNGSEPPTYRMPRDTRKTRVYFDIDPERNEQLLSYQRERDIGNAGTVLRLAVVRWIDLAAEVERTECELKSLEEGLDNGSLGEGVEEIRRQARALRNRLSALRARGDL